MEYTEHQKAYIDSVDGIAHNSAVVLIGLLDARIADLEQQLAAAQEREAAYAEYKRKLEAIVMWLERNEPSVFARGLWDAINE